MIIYCYVTNHPQNLVAQNNSLLLLMLLMAQSLAQMLQTFGLSMITEEWQLCLESFVRLLDMDWQDVFFTYMLVISLHDRGLKVLRIYTHTHTHTERERYYAYIFLSFSPSLYTQRNFLSLCSFSHPSRNSTAGKTTFLLDYFCLQEIT